MICTNCQHEIDSHPKGDPPSKGDITLCYECGTLFIWTADLGTMICTKEIEAMLWAYHRTLMEAVAGHREKIAQKIALT